MSTRQFAAQRPILAALFCAGLQFLITVLILKAGTTFFPPEMFGKIKLVAFASTVILPLLLVQAFGLWRQVGFEFDKMKPGPVFFASLVICALFLSMGVHPQEHGGIGGEVAMQFVNAFGEELLFRGVIFAILLSQPRWQAIAISGVLFGCMHLIHGFMDGNWAHAMWWAAATSVSGMMFAAVRYGTGSLWLTILLHMFVNLSKIYSNVEVAGGPAAMQIVERAAFALEIALTLYVIYQGTRRRALPA